MTESLSEDRLILPLPPVSGQESRFEMEIYARFMSHLRKVPSCCENTRILSSLCFTADMLDTGEALVAKTLVDLGLRAPRAAFPESFLNFADKALQRQIWGQATAPHAIQTLATHWQTTEGDAAHMILSADFRCPRERSGTRTCV